MEVYEQIQRYEPFDEQESRDRKQILDYMRRLSLIHILCERYAVT